jgi:hypothetical protein
MEAPSNNLGTVTHLRRGPRPEPQQPEREEPQECPPDRDRGIPFNEPSYPGIEPLSRGPEQTTNSHK